MFRKNRWLSILSLVWAVLQFALPVVASYLDAAEAATPSAAASIAHVEEGPGSSCQPPHSAECSVCRYLSSFAGDAPEHARMQVVTEAAHIPPTCVQSHRLGGIAARPLSRAPPAL